MEGPQPTSTLKTAIDRRSALIAAAMTGFIVYGSVYPFHFWANPNPAGPLRALLSTWSSWTRPADITANILLYFPLGFFISRAVSSRRAVMGLAFAATVGVTLSVTMESLQFYVIGRDSAMSDVYSDTTGIILGGLPVTSADALGASLF